MRLLPLKRRLFFYFLLVFSVGILTPGGLFCQTGDIEHDPLEYDVQINAHIVPVFAVDKDGNPVYDLKEDEIELFVDKKRYDVLSFSRYLVAEEKKVDAGRPKAPVAKSHSERIIFLILDGMTSNIVEAVKNSRIVAKGLVNSGKPGDAFIIITANAFQGFRYIVGPEKNKERLCAIIDSVYDDPKWIHYVPRITGAPLASMGVMRGGRVNTMNTGALEYNSTISRMKRGLSGADKTQYVGILNRFAYSLRDLKYALKTIRWPKMIYIISGGLRHISGIDIHSANGYVGEYYDLMKKSVRRINEGGALLYMINPIVVHRYAKSIRNAVKYMSKIANAKCISGTNMEEVLTKVEKNTSAYYEVAFAINSKLDDHFNIKVKCKRKGVTLNTLRHGEKSKKYTDMKDMQKKLFALNVVTGGSWSRIMGKISPAQLTNLSADSEKKKKKIKVEISIPEEIQNKKLDIFVLQVDQVTLKADIEMEQKIVGETSTVDVKLKDGERQFVVLVEPQKARCFYNMVRLD